MHEFVKKIDWVHVNCNNLKIIRITKKVYYRRIVKNHKQKLYKKWEKITCFCICIGQNQFPIFYNKTGFFGAQKPFLPPGKLNKWMVIIHFSYSYFTSGKKINFRPLLAYFHKIFFIDNDHPNCSFPTPELILND